MIVRLRHLLHAILVGQQLRRIFTRMKNALKSRKKLIFLTEILVYKVYGQNV